METVTLICNWCGRPCLEGSIVSENPNQESDAKWLVMCHQCFGQTKTCTMCLEGNKCPFETDTSCPLPKQVQQTVRQGQMVMQTVVMNPDRVEKICKMNCKCWSDDFGCLKQNGTCGQYEEVIP